MNKVAGKYQLILALKVNSSASQMNDWKQFTSNPKNWLKKKKGEERKEGKREGRKERCKEEKGNRNTCGFKFSLHLI